MTEHVAYFAVLALANAECQPHIGALNAIERGFDRPIMDTLDGHAMTQAVELVLRNCAVRSHAVAAQPAGRRQFEEARQSAVVRKKQQSLGVEIEPADADQARKIARQFRKDRGAPL